MLSARDAALLPLAAGKWLQRAHLQGENIHKSGAMAPVKVGIDVVTNDQNRIMWLGQALREQGVAGRLREHLRKADRLRMFKIVRVLELKDFTPPECVSSIEGKAADLLRLRGALGVRRWPTSDRWPELAI